LRTVLNSVLPPYSQMQSEAIPVCVRRTIVIT
jgi:hypothetical protein